MTHSQTTDNWLVRAKVVRRHRLDPEIAREVPKPVHESVRIALDWNVQRQNFARRGVSDRDRFLAIRASRSLVRACHRYRG